MRQDLLLAVKRQMIGVLVGDHMGQQSRTRQPLVDRLGRLGRDGHMLLARPAGVLAADELADEKRGRDVVQLLADLVGEMGAKPAQPGQTPSCSESSITTGTRGRCSGRV